MVQALEFYSGIGAFLSSSLCIILPTNAQAAFTSALTASHVPGRVIRAYDWDQNACRIYSQNYGKGIVYRADISTLTAADIGDLGADLWLLSPACQPYTVLNPNAKGAGDPRAKSVLHLIQNVIQQYLRRRGPAIFWWRTLPGLRYYLLARRKPWVSGMDQGVLKEIPGRVVGEVKTVRDYLDHGGEEYMVSDRVLTKWGRLFDIVLPGDRKTCCFTSGNAFLMLNNSCYTHLVERAGSILQMNEELDTTKTFDEFLLTADLAILRPLRLRYFTPNELLRIFDFDSSSFQWPDNVSRKTKYRLIGNSVNVKPLMVPQLNRLSILLNVTNKLLGTLHLSHLAVNENLERRLDGVHGVTNAQLRSSTCKFGKMSDEKRSLQTGRYSLSD
ncbi:S-adenosyl-L-methionine-dependent methyltransferase [Armillaria luteobubalina]|uniref:S-adenosyl-L-methionine-dependent methyltransferase n=1 Tax=Armillaria luteobubalina TaxID=153913 RepID=A0AA39V0T0_9AGAR|nr:S-adenosyl-L-methionine-dependent methyltransferase [Armillaria luteobubalina]